MAKQGNIKSVRKKEPATVWERNQLGVSLLAECQQLEASRNQQGSCACCHSETKTDVTKGKLLLKRDDSPLPNLTNIHKSVFSKRLPQNISNRSHVVELVTPRTTSCCERLPVVLNHCTPVNFSSWTSMNTQLPKWDSPKPRWLVTGYPQGPKPQNLPQLSPQFLHCSDGASLHTWSRFWQWKFCCSKSGWKKADGLERSMDLLIKAAHLARWERDKIAWDFFFPP